MARAADALGVVRLAVAVAMPGVLGGAGPRWLPLALFAVAAATDYVDGPLARATGGPTSHGAALDNLADIAFVLATIGTAAARGVVSWAAPAAIALAFSLYVAASVAGRRRAGPVVPARSRVGHAGGVLNYVLAGLIAGAVALPGAAWPAILGATTVAVVLVNGAAVVGRFNLPARATPAAGSRARSAHS